MMDARLMVSLAPYIQNHGTCQYVGRENRKLGEKK